MQTIGGREVVCPPTRRKELGCTSEAPREHYKGSDYPTRRCPRWHIKQTRGLIGVLDLYHHTDCGQLGAGVLDMPNPLVDALHLVAAGKAWKREQEKPNRG